MKTIKGPAIFLAQFMGDAPPFDTLENIARWVADLGFGGVQLPAWDSRCIDLCPLFAFEILSQKRFLQMHNFLGINGNNCLSNYIARPWQHNNTKNPDKKKDNYGCLRTRNPGRNEKTDATKDRNKKNGTDNY